MRKWLILIILLFYFSIANAGQLRVLSPFISSGAVCTEDTGSPVMDNSTADTGDTLSSTQASGESVSIGGGSWNFASFTINHTYNSSCVITVRIGSGEDLSNGNYDEEWANVSLPDGSGTYKFTSSLNTSYTTAYIGAMKVSGTCGWSRANSNIYANGARYSYVDSTGWVLSSPKAATDMNGKVLKCQ